MLNTKESREILLIFVYMKGYVTRINNYIYFTDLDRTPVLGEPVVKGKVVLVYIYTLDQTDTASWMANNYFPRRRKLDKYTRPVVLSNDPRLNLKNFTNEQLNIINNNLDPNKIIEL